ncbi:MAG: PorT family protein [Chitinophagales bacterium]|nr:PorT family protein [Chitinophagales bacterium]MDW8428168.1 porin family protein [Chitinophagales bacterium]
MAAPVSRHLYLVVSLQIGGLLLAVPAAAQYNVYGHTLKYEARNFHFGIALGLNFSNYKVTMDSLYLEQGEITVTSPLTSPGFSLGIISSLHLSNSFELRFIPDLAFADRSLLYQLTSADSTPTKRIESVYLEFPFNIKYRSKPYRDFRLYVLSGLKYSIDMQSNATARLAENLIKVYKHDIAFEYGVGGEFHLPLVTVAPEIKVSYGLTNILKPDPNLIYARVLERLRARTFMIAIHFEG